MLEPLSQLKNAMRRLFLFKAILVFSALAVMTTACGSSRDKPYNIINDISERTSNTHTIQFSQSEILPPYGVKAVAEKAVLKLHISSSQNNAKDRVEDIQRAIDEVSRLADDDNVILVEEISLEQISGSYARAGSEISNIQNVDTSAITIKLSIELQQGVHFLESVAVFNDFLNMINLPDTITLNVLSVEAELGDLEAYRSQIVAQVYQELDSMQEKYGQTVKFEVTGLYGPLKKLQLNDVEYYLYLEPIITILEF